MNIALQLMYARRRRLQAEAVKPVFASPNVAVKALFDFDPKAGDPTPSRHFSEAFKGWSEGGWGLVDPKGNTHYGDNETVFTHDDLSSTLGFKNVAHAMKHGYVRWTTNHTSGEANLQFLDKPGYRKGAIKHLQSIPRDYNVRMDVMDSDGSYKPYFWPNPGYAIRHLRGEKLGEVRSEITPESLADHYGYGEEIRTDSHKFGNVVRYLHPEGHNLIVVHRYQKARDQIGDSKHPGEWSLRWEHVSRDGVTSQGHTTRQLLQHLFRTHSR